MHGVGKLAAAAGVFAISACLSAPVAAQDLREGEWSGTIRNTPPRNANPRPASLIVEKGPDPHWRWRGGANEIVTITFTAAQLTAEVAEIRLADGRLTYSFDVPDGTEDDGSCELSAQPDGRYEGQCQQIFNGVLITLTPPDEVSGEDGEEAVEP